MFELIYRIFSDNKSDEIIVLIRSCNIEDINSVVDKYKIPIRTDLMTNYYGDGFWIRELPEKPLNENLLNHYLEYHKNTEWKRR